jgi:hypothetical protein
MASIAAPQAAPAAPHAARALGRAKSGTDAPGSPVLRGAGAGPAAAAGLRHGGQLALGLRRRLRRGAVAADAGGRLRRRRRPRRARHRAAGHGAAAHAPRSGIINPCSGESHHDGCRDIAGGSGMAMPCVPRTTRWRRSTGRGPAAIAAARRCTLGTPSPPPPAAAARTRRGRGRQTAQRAERLAMFARPAGQENRKVLEDAIALQSRA